MKIAIIGASGKAGSLIAKEAMSRGHLVTAIVRDSKKAEGHGFHQIIQRDIYDLTETDVADFDAVVNAFGVFGSDDTVHQRATEHLISVFSNLPDVRLLVVGGAGSLYTDPQKEHTVAESIPPEYASVPRDMAASLEMLKQSHLNWTYFSPASTFDPDGIRTGKYMVGSDFVITNATNESYISYADYAVAMVDEIENGFHKQERFTAVSDGYPVTRKDKLVCPTGDKSSYYGLDEVKPEFYGLSQYCPPFCYELEGRQFHLVMDKQEDFFINFLNGNMLEWSRIGKKSKAYSYECLKGTDLVYFVHFELTGTKPYTDIVLILDLEQNLVTYIRSWTEFSKKYPYLVRSDYDFGAIAATGRPLPESRHCFTEDLVGKRIGWRYTPDTEIVHIYYSSKNMTVGFTEEFAPSELMDMDYSEPVTYIKIRDGLYCINCIEENMSKKGMTGNSLCLLIDTKRVHDVGRFFGHGGMETGHIHTENYCVSAMGRFLPSDGILEAAYREKYEK